MRSDGHPDKHTCQCQAHLEKVSFKGFLPGSYSNIIIIMRAAGNLRDCPFLEHETRIVCFHSSFTLNNWLHWEKSGWMPLVLPGEREAAFASSHLSEWDWVLLLCCLMPTTSETQLCWYTKNMRKQLWDPLCTGDAPWLQDIHPAFKQTEAAFPTPKNNLATWNKYCRSVLTSFPLSLDQCWLQRRKQNNYQGTKQLLQSFAH